MSLSREQIAQRYQAPSMAFQNSNTNPGEA
jgi:hypothetical protein